MGKHFLEGQEIDINQSEIKSGLLQMYKDTEPRYPDQFNGRSCFLQDVSGRYYKIRLSVKEVTLDKEVLDDINYDHSKAKYVLCYNDHVVGRHCVFVEVFEAENQRFSCMNSNGEINKYPQVPVDQPGLQIYKLACHVKLEKERPKERQKDKESTPTFNQNQKRKRIHF